MMRSLSLSSISTAAAVRLWLGLAALLTVAVGVVYGTQQQALRQGANDPQIQIAEDGAADLGRGAAPDAVAGQGTVDMAASLAPFTIVYDGQGRVLASSARLDGVTPSLPSGVLEYARAHGQDRLTWQPRPGVRIAAVVERAGDGAVLSGRSLREVEARVDQLDMLCMAGWLGGLAVLAAAVIGGQWLTKLWPSD